jgi:predicted TIM-barrel fold metal-dependent hydrolase
MKIIVFKLIMVMFLFFMISCHQSTYDSMKSYIDQIKVIDTHSHQGMPWKKRHNLFDAGMYLHTDLISAGMPEYTLEMKERHDASEYWDHTEAYLRFCRTTSYYTQFIYNYSELYGLEGSVLTKADFLKYSSEMDDKFKNYGDWLDSCFERCNIDYMFADRVWQPFDTNFNQKYFRYVFRIDELVLDVTSSAQEKKITNAGSLKLLSKDELPVPDLQSYLSYIDEIIESLIEHDVVSFKIGLAYHRSIDFAKTEHNLAEQLFLQQTFSDIEKKKLQDFIVSYIVNKSIDYKIPVQIHTGYRHGNRSLLDTGHPMKLLHLIYSNPKAQFVLFHGGFPWMGDYMVLGKNFPNVYLDIVWLPQLSRSAAIRTLHEILDCVPYNKICWGSDVGNIDDAAGSLELGREVVARVLSERIDNGWISEEIAHDIAQRIFRENAIDIFNLN